MTQIELNNLFNYHAPKDDQSERNQQIRIYAKEFAEIIQDSTPASAEQTLAIRAVHQAMMHANSAIAVNE